MGARGWGLVWFVTSPNPKGIKLHKPYRKTVDRSSNVEEEKLSAGAQRRMTGFLG
jgi:hypothetical protein